MDKQDKTENIRYEDLPSQHNDPLVEFLNKTIRIAVKVLAILMVFVIIWGIGDVIYVLYKRLMLPPIFLLSISDILATFGAFLAVLIAIEIFINITVYIRNDVLPVKLVVATALMAISRRVDANVYSRNSSGCIGTWSDILVNIIKVESNSENTPTHNHRKSKK